MTISKSKTTTLIALFLMLTIAVSIIALPIANAQIPTRYLPNNVYISAQPITGVNEKLIISYFMDRLPIDVGEAAGRVPGKLRAHWAGLVITVTHPDGTNETLNMPDTDPVGGGWFFYTPTELGTYYLQILTPAQWKNTTFATVPYNTLYSADMSPPCAFVVQQEAIVRWRDVPLPTDYWMRPISGNAATWSVLASNWLGGAANNYPVGSSGGTTTSYGYGPAPESPHILWTRQNYPTGDIEDTRFGTVANRYGGYQAVGWTNNIILDGKIHSETEGSVYTVPGDYQIWDLKTGELLYTNHTQTQPSVGQIYWYDSGNEHGLNLILWRTSGIELPQIVRCANATQSVLKYLPLRLTAEYTINRTATPTALVTGTLVEMIDAYTGATMAYIANASTGGTEVRDKLGARLFYSAVNYGTTAAPNYYLQIWNSSAGTMIASQNGTGAWQWRPSGGSGSGASVSYFGSAGTNCVHDGRLMFTLNVSIASILGPRNAVLNQTGSIQAVREGEYIIFGANGQNNQNGVQKGFLKCYSLVPGEEGRLLWESTFTPPINDATWYQQVSGIGSVNPENEVILFNSETELINPIVYDMKTGTELWRGNATEEPQYGFYGYQTMIYENMIITGGSHSGVNTAYEARTGEIIWRFTATPVGSESPYGNDLSRGFTVSDGKLFTSISEHSPSSPLWRSPGLKCINITTGELMWQLLAWPQSIKISDGMLTYHNLYDGQVYCIGKGPSGTTVSAPQTIPALGSSVTLTGTVTDQTPTGRRNVNNLMDFTLKGTPAISDEDMRYWMEYKFMGQGKPTNAKGVNVTLTAIDPNNNYIPIGTTTSDITGAYGFVWTPEVPGTYQIYATFAGSKAYYGSSAITYMGVGPEAIAQTFPEPQPPFDPTMTILYAAIAIIIAVALVGFLLFRKKP